MEIYIYIYEDESSVDLVFYQDLLHMTKVDAGFAQ